MPIFVEHKETHDLYILISGGYGSYQSAVRTELKMTSKSWGTDLMVCVCDRNSELGWFPSDTVRVVHIDGTKVEDLFDLGPFKTS